MKVLICGIDGYIGWPLKKYLENIGLEVFGFDNFLRRRLVAEVGSDSLIPIKSPEERGIRFGGMTDYVWLKNFLNQTRPDAIIHLAEQPSAPYSMISPREAAFTQYNNVIGTLNLLWAMRKAAPDAHLIKLGTMGEYGTPNIEIPEGFIEIEFRGRKDTLPFPKQGGSFYHLSKSHDSLNIMMACRWWGLHATDLNQGVMHGHLPETRFDYDSYFGTVINRFVTEAAINHHLTIYGKGRQKRGFIHLADTLKCIELAIKNPATGYRVFNQFTEIFSVEEIANIVARLTGAEIRKIDNPRIESEEHFYKPENRRLLELGLTPTSLAAELPRTLAIVKEFKARIKKELILPKTHWRN